MPKLPQYLKKLPDGRYEARLNTRDRDGSRVQLRRRFDCSAAAVDWYTRTAAALNEGTYTAPVNLTTREACEGWLAAKELRVKPTTNAAYRAALAPVVAAYGGIPVQKVRKADVESLVAELLAGTGGRKWQRNSVNPMLARWRAVWSGLQAEGIIERNVVAMVEPLRKPAGTPALKVTDTLTVEQAEHLLAVHRGHHHEAFLHLALMGLRRGELAGLRWSAVTLDSETPSVTIHATRISTAGGVFEQTGGKTASAARVLPLPRAATSALKRIRAEQRRIRLAAGRFWVGDEDGHVLAISSGKGASPRTLDSWWHKALDRAGLPQRRLHAARHSAASLLHARGASAATIARWLGHADGGGLAMRVYIQVHDEALAAAAKLFG
jgi:integrase